MGNGGQGMKLTAYPLSCQGKKITDAVILPLIYIHIMLKHNFTYTFA
jgi:hypothetical protein